MTRPDRTAVLVILLAAVAALARLPFLGWSMLPDEAGFTMVATQWHLGAGGSSVYGDYWVDRPPLLIALFEGPELLARSGLVGGAVALRLLGVAAVVASVLFAGRLGRHLAGRRGAVVAAAVAAVFLTSPMYGSRPVNGELLAVPFVLASLVVLLGVPRPDRPDRETRQAGPASRAVAERWLVAGLLAAAGSAVKQNMLDGFVAATVVLLWLLWRRRTRLALTCAAAYGIGALTCVGLLFAWAAAHGTAPGELLDATVAFRFEAGAVISEHRPATAGSRALTLLGSYAASGGLLVLLAALLPIAWGLLRALRTAGRPAGVGSAGPGPDAPASPDVERQPGDVALLVITVAVVAWELFGVVAGGSYWLHYLVGTVPGLVLAAALAVRVAGRRSSTRYAPRVLLAAVAGSAIVTSCAIVTLVVHGSPSTQATRASAFLAQRVHPGDTGVVAFGQPSVLYDAGLDSPYEHLWSLPVRVRDPRLVEFTRLLQSRRAPDWVVVHGARLGGWGLDASRADPVLARDYRRVRVIGDLHIWEHR